VGCQKEEDFNSTPPRPYDEVYEEDIAEIEEFLNTHYVTIDSENNTEFFEIEEGGTETPISAMPELVYKDLYVESHNVNYKIYYLNLREGIGESPTKIDSAMFAYKGFSFKKVTTTEIVGGETVISENTSQILFDEKIAPVWFKLDEVIKGWSEIIPLFKTGTIDYNSSDGTYSYNNFGSGVMFIPSGLGYFNSSVGNISSYSPLVFNFKLYNQKYRDHDSDRILSKDEYDFDNNGEIDDTDGDGYPNYLDPDDDGDGYLTKYEIRYEPDPVGNPGVYDYYDFPSIPTCNGTLKKHLDPSCH